MDRVLDAKMTRLWDFRQSLVELGIFFQVKSCAGQQRRNLKRPCQLYFLGYSYSQSVLFLTTVDNLTRMGTRPCLVRRKV